jgi:hypothetical protein
MMKPKPSRKGFTRCIRGGSLIQVSRMIDIYSPLSALPTAYLQLTYTLSTPCLQLIYSLSTPYLHPSYTLSAPCLQLTYSLSTFCSTSMYTCSTSMYTCSTSMYTCSVHTCSTSMYNTTCRVGSNTTSYDQHVCWFVHVHICWHGVLGANIYIP